MIRMFVGIELPLKVRMALGVAVTAVTLVESQLQPMNEFIH